MPRKIPFAVSARTARLIGRENVASAEGAITELVKNSYDADASVCILYFDGDSNLHIVDDGEGMTDTIIESHWMLIGTNNKVTDFVTESGRTKAGAKGIGRFALDRLGDRCKLITQPKQLTGARPGFEWSVNWKDFESSESKSLDQVTATLDTLHNLDYSKRVSDILGPTIDFPPIKSDNSFTSGTAISIQGLRDDWGKSELARLYQSLKSLIPPIEESRFSVFLVSQGNPSEWGKVDSITCDDYDYKLTANADAHQNVSIEITRNEIDLEALDKTIFDRPGMKDFPFDRDTLLSKTYNKTMTLNQLVPGLDDRHFSSTLNDIGEFKFAFYFLKKQSTSSDKKRLYYKDYNAKLRNDWLKEHVGIRIYRDGFRVRPYGEPNGNASDWLNLGLRYAASPAGVAKKSGGFKVREHNISGVVNISRQKNINFADQSSREGIQENKAFELFKRILVGIIEVFEKDRSYIARELVALSDSQDQREKIAREAERIRKDRAKASEGNGGQAFWPDEKDFEILTKHTEFQQEKIEELLSEQKILRVLASSGTMVVSFIHELNGIRNDLVSRSRTIRKQITPLILPESLKGIAPHKDPFVSIDEMEASDLKLAHWMQFALGTIRKDKRKRKNISLPDYLQSLKKLWNYHLTDREVTLRLSLPKDDISLHAFEVDLDTVFSNLIINSLDAFERTDAPAVCEIEILVRRKSDTSATIVYRDTGPGLHKDIGEPERIFDIFFSTKLDASTGDQIGSGIGMWLVKSTLEEYRGEARIRKSEAGFCLDIEIPILS